MQPLEWLTDHEKRPLAICAISALLVLLGSFISLLGVVTLGLHIKTQVQFNPFHNTISILLNHWEIAAFLISFGLWWFWTGLGLWKLRPAPVRSAWVISGLVLVRGLLALLPPIEAGDLTVAAWLAVPAAVVMILLRRSSKALA